MLRKDFLWGGAVTAHQSEGGYTLDGKVPAVCDSTVTGEYSDLKTESIVTIVMKRILIYFRKWDLMLIVFT